MLHVCKTLDTLQARKKLIRNLVIRCSNLSCAAVRPPHCSDTQEASLTIEKSRKLVQAPTSSFYTTYTSHKLTLQHAERPGLHEHGDTGKGEVYVEVDCPLKVCMRCSCVCSAVNVCKCVCVSHVPPSTEEIHP